MKREFLYQFVIVLLVIGYFGLFILGFLSGSWVDCSSCPSRNFKTKEPVEPSSITISNIDGVIDTTYTYIFKDGK